MGRKAAEAERSGDRSEVKQVGSEPARNLEWDLIQRVLARLWNSFLGLEGTDAQGTASGRIPESLAQRVLNKVPLQVTRRLVTHLAHRAMEGFGEEKIHEAGAG